MVVPALIGAGGAIGSAVLGLIGQRNQQAAAQAQMVMAQRMLEQQEENARRQYELATAGTTTARGDVTRFTPGMGWSETLGPVSRQLLGASDAEALRRYGAGARADIGRRQNFDRRQLESSAADTELRRFINMRPRGVGEIQGALTEAGIADVNDPLDRQQEAVNLQALRSGTGASHVIDALAQRGRTGVRSAIANARLRAPGMAEEEASTRGGNTLNRYGALASRASNVDDVPFQPSTVADVLAQRTDVGRAVAPQAVGGASAALGRGMAGMEGAYGRSIAAQPEYGLAFASAAQGLEGLYNNLFKRRAYNPGGGSGGTSSFGR